MRPTQACDVIQFLRPILLHETDTRHTRPLSSMPLVGPYPWSLMPSFTSSALHYCPTAPSRETVAFYMYQVPAVSNFQSLLYTDLDRNVAGWKWIGSKGGHNQHVCDPYGVRYRHVFCSFDGCWQPDRAHAPDCHRFDFNSLRPTVDEKGVRCLARKRVGSGCDRQPRVQVNFDHRLVDEHA
eukprot:COSAG02_NODE_1726_length_11183_cov_93.592746_3_plen_182_part_00